MSNCTNCVNNGYVICDTNLFIFLMDYIFNKNPRIRIRDLCNKLEAYLQVICDCSENNKINVSDVLYDYEMENYHQISMYHKFFERPLDAYRNLQELRQFHQIFFHKKVIH